MANTFFEFKQFTIQQSNCAMKVCTDSCLFGAIIAEYLPNENNALDIGSGTGLLSLMYAQKNAATIDAVEIDEAAYLQSKNNILNAKFASSISIINNNILNYISNKKYQLIISNPPFFKNSLKAVKENRNIAMHNDELSYELLVKKVVELLDTNGIFAVLIPFYAKENLIEIASKNNLFNSKSIDIKQTTKHTFFRTILFFSFNKKTNQTINIAIKDENNNYTNEFSALLKDYYLFL